MFIQLADIANDRLLKAAAIYGANASGKSNVYEAFEHMSYYVKESFNFGGEDEGSRREKIICCQGGGRWEIKWKDS